MNTRCLVLALIFLYAMAVLWSPAHAETSYEGTSKGTVIRKYKVEYITFESSVKNGPWNKSDTDSIPTVAVIGIGGADAGITRIVNAAVKVVPDILSGVPGLKVVPNRDVKKYLKSKGVPDNPKSDHLGSIICHALSIYDVVLIARFYNTWLGFDAIHAISDNNARHHGHSAYLPGSPSDQEVRDAVKQDQIVFSINMALGKQKE